MNSENSKIQRKVSELVEDFVDGTIEPVELAELRKLLESSEEARQHFREHNLLSEMISACGLRDSAIGSADAPKKSAGHKQNVWPVRKPSAYRIAFAIAASLLVGMGLLTWFWNTQEASKTIAKQQDGPSRTTDNKPSTDSQLAVRPQSPDSPIAVLLDSTAAEWKTEGIGETSGIPLRKGWLELTNGTVVIRFNSGAVVTLIGPARFQLIDPFQGFLASGSVAANVPEQAEGFQVHTDTIRLTDLGTEFAIRVGDTGSAEVHVIDGLVEVECETVSLKNETFTMRKNDAKSFSSKLAPENLQLDQGFASKIVVSRPTQRIGYYTFESVNQDGQWYTDPAAISVGGDDVSFHDFTYKGVAPGPAEWPKNLNRWSFKAWQEEYQPDYFYVGFKVASQANKLIRLDNLCLQLFRAGGNDNAGMAPQDGLVRVSSDGFKTFQDFVLLDKETFVNEPKFIGVKLDRVQPAAEHEFRFLFKGQSKARAIRLDEVTVDLDVEPSQATK